MNKSFSSLRLATQHFEKLKANDCTLCMVMIHDHEDDVYSIIDDETYVYLAYRYKLPMTVLQYS